MSLCNRTHAAVESRTEDGSGWERSLIHGWVTQDTEQLAFHTGVYREAVLSGGVWSTQPATDSGPRLPRWADLLPLLHCSILICKNGVH